MRPAKFVRIFLPREINLKHSSHRQMTIAACRSIREAFLRDKLDIILDFSRTRKLQSEGMLLIVAELDRAIRMAPDGQVVHCKLPSEVDLEAKIVRQVLEQIGLLHRIGASSAAPSRGDDEYEESVRHWRYATGTRVDEKPGNVLEEHEGRVAPGLMTSMQVGLAEALINSGHHAYRADRQDGCPPFREKRWWMFTHERDGMLSVTVCDLGIGIPRSLPLTWDRALLKRLGAFFTGTPPQVAAVQMALVLGESSTGDTHRGKGLPQIWNATQASSAGGVGIHSGRAYVSFDSETGNRHDRQFATDIQGTLISWTFSVEAADGTGRSDHDKRRQAVLTGSGWPLY